MTAAIQATQPTTPQARQRQFRWQPWALALICLLATGVLGVDLRLSRLVGAAAAVIEGTAAVFLLHRTVGRWAGEHVPLLAVLWLVAAAYALARALSGLVLAGVTLLVVPSVWSGATAFAATRSGGAMAQAGPTETRRGFERGGLTAQDQRILAYVSKAAQWIIGSDLTVIGMGGSAGTDGAPTTAQLADWVRTGQLRPADARFRPQRAASTQRDTWVRQHCTVVNPSVYGGNGQTLYSCTGS